ncbi:hypothetical protein [Methanosphaera sp. WGK6]|uniref:hypothetical protein n=1 Tax=Methanosphaera sp. WGK6 TaxID=1561964 RepID=UPI00084C1594|nr:hypothetical protein [Methanosphaera sp. WGK6]OED30394.1 hypothetical protein NL43_03230 [Methanosphaera sp. WGK6]
MKEVIQENKPYSASSLEGYEYDDEAIDYVISHNLDDLLNSLYDTFEKYSTKKPRLELVYMSHGGELFVKLVSEIYDYKERFNTKLKLMDELYYINHEYTRYIGVLFD